MHRRDTRTTPRLVFLASTLLAIGTFAPACPARTDPGSPREEPTAPVRVAPEILDPKGLRIGEWIGDWSFVDVDGIEGKLSDYAGHRATVIAVHSIDCPLSKKWTPKLARLQNELQDRGVALLLVNFIDGETSTRVREFREDYGITSMRYVLDPEGHLAKELGVTTTTETFLLDSSRTLRYRGAFDDQYGLGYALEAPRFEPLRDALAAVLERKMPEVPATTAPGCALDLDAEPAPLREITYHNRVSRILQANCQTCHRPGEAGPFSLLTYEDAKRVKGMMKYVVENRIMPPWFAEGGDHDWANDTSLTDRERADLLAWLEAGCPEGNDEEAVTPVAWTEGWQIGEPDLVVQIPRVFRVPAEGSLPYQYAKVRLPIEEDRWVHAMEIRPTAAQVVHHALVMIQYPRRHPKDLEQPDFQDGLDGYFAVMVPGQGPTVFPPGTAKFLPRGSQLVFQMHYTPIGKEMEDQTKMAFRFADGPPEREVQTRGISDTRFAIPPGAERHAVSATHRFDTAANLLGFFPHMHLRGTAFRYEIRYPDGRKELLLDVPRYDFNWQLFYRLREPLEVPEGTVIQATGWFDNSASNPANPDPRATVHFGQQTWEEMMIGYFDWVPSS